MPNAQSFGAARAVQRRNNEEISAVPSESCRLADLAGRSRRRALLTHLGEFRAEL